MRGSAAAPTVPSAATNRPELTLAASPHIALLVLALLLTAITYMATLRFDFVYDDPVQIVSNAAVHSWKFAPSYFTHDVWSHLYPGAPGSYYRPLFMLWLLVNFSFFGLQPMGWHLTTVLAHLGVTVMVYWLVRRVTGDATTAAIAALLFGVHPAHIEAVAWVSGVTEPLLALLLIPAFVFYLNAHEQRYRRRSWMAASLGLYALALLSKETAIVLPALVFGYEWLYDEDRRAPKARLLHAILLMSPYAAVSLVYMAVRHMVLSAPTFGESAIGVGGVLLTWPSLIWLYLKHLVWPFGLSVFYDTPYILHPTLNNFVLPLLACVVVTAALVWWSRKSKTAAIAFLWLMLPLLPPLAGIGLFSHNDLTHDRYLYVPSIGFVILVATLLRRIRTGHGVEKGSEEGIAKRTAQNERFGLPGVQLAAVLVLTVALAAGAAIQSVRWANNLLLYHYGVQTAPHSALARMHLGAAIMARGDMSTALRLYREALELSPDDWTPNFVLGYADLQAQRYAEAEQHLRAAIRITPSNANQYLYLGLTLMHLDRLDEAEATLRRGLAPSPQVIGGLHYALGMVLQKKGQVAAARDEYKAELQLDPNSAARINLAEVEKQLAGGRPLP
jgi:protein O-mannosyl-transferase